MRRQLADGGVQIELVRGGGDSVLPFGVLRPGHRRRVGGRIVVEEQRAVLVEQEGLGNHRADERTQTVAEVQHLRHTGQRQLMPNSHRPPDATRRSCLCQSLKNVPGGTGVLKK